MTVKAKPIVFSTWEVRQILAGKKTQTRQLADFDSSVLIDVCGTPFREYWNPEKQVSVRRDIECKFGDVGDRLWVKESWAYDAMLLLCNAQASAQGRSCHGPYYRVDKVHERSGLIWRPAINMPRWASRLTLEVKSVCAERLQDITEADALAEGMPIPVGPGKINGKSGVVAIFDPRLAFRLWWDSKYGKRAPWSSNPYVWRREIELVQNLTALGAVKPIEGSPKTA